MARFLRGFIDPVLRFLGFAGDFSRLTFSRDEVPQIAVVIRRNLPWCATHTGIAHRSAGQLKVLHLAGHEWLRNDLAIEREWAYAIPLIRHEKDREYLAGFCRRIHRANAQGNIPYAFTAEPDIIFEYQTGKFVCSSPGDGFIILAKLDAYFGPPTEVGAEL